MRATVMYGAGDVRIENVPDAASSNRPTPSSRVTRACICGSDLWPYKTMEPSETGRRMGHEAIGVVEAVGADVRTVKIGDLVVMPFAYSDGTCVFCHEGLHTSCVHGGFFGTAEVARSAGRSGARPAGRRNALRPAGRQGRRADAVAAHALRRDGHRPSCGRHRQGRPRQDSRGRRRRRRRFVRRDRRAAPRRRADHHPGPSSRPDRARERVRRDRRRQRARRRGGRARARADRRLRRPLRPRVRRHSTSRC